MQFAVQNGAKLLVPLVGGYVIDAIGLLPGFDLVLFLCALGYLVYARVDFLMSRPLLERNFGSLSGDHSRIRLSSNLSHCLEEEV